MKIALLCNDDLTTNIIFAPVFDVPGLSIKGIFFTASPSARHNSLIGGAWALLRKMDARYWLYLCFTNGVFKLFETLKGSPRSGPLVSLRALARQHDVPVQVVSDFADPAFVAQVKAMGIDLLLIRVGAILKPVLLDVPRHGTWCVHSSLLPAFKGIAGEFHALRHPGAPIGSTVFEVTPKLDAGPSLAQVTIARDDPASVFSHMLRNNKAAGALLAQMLAAKQAGQPMPGTLHQPPLPASYFSWPKPGDFKTNRASLISPRECLNLILYALRLKR